MLVNLVHLDFYIRISDRGAIFHRNVHKTQADNLLICSRVSPVIISYLQVAAANIHSAVIDMLLGIICAVGDLDINHCIRFTDHRPLHGTNVVIGNGRIYILYPCTIFTQPCN